MGIAERKEREKEQRRNAILEAAEKVFFSKGIEDATMDEVAEAAELSKGTLYLYYNSKEDLVHAVIGRGLDILYSMFTAAEKKEQRGIDKITAVGKAYFEFYKKETNYFNTMMHQETGDMDEDYIEKNPNVKQCMEKGDEIFGLLEEIVETGIEDESIRPDLEPMKLAFVLWGQSFGMMQIVASKGKIIENILGSSTDELINYSLGLMRTYLENRK